MSCECRRDVMTMTDPVVEDYEEDQSFRPNFKHYASNRNAGLCLPCFRNPGRYGESVRKYYFK